MNKTCARCQKVVYPIEELKCLDKTWHKTCFKCTECGMALNMKTYKGYNKMPYCEAHIPKAKATAIADTPELKRIAENTKIQSNVKYHADFEKAKGKFTQVADDPETLRIKQNTKHISNVAYHGDLEKKAAMEKQRGSAEVSDSSTQSQQQQLQHQQLQQQLQQQQLQQQQQQQQQSSAPTNAYNQLRSSILQNSHHPSGNAVDQYDHGRNASATMMPPPPSQQQQPHQQHMANNNINSHNNNVSLSYAQVQPQQQQQQSSQQIPAQTRSSNHSMQSWNNAASVNSVIHKPSSNTVQQLYASTNYVTQTPSEGSVGAAKVHATNGSANGGFHGVNHASNNIGKIADYDPLTDGPRAMPSTGRSSTTLVYSSDQRGAGGGNSVYPKRIGSVSDIDPANGIYGSLSSEQATAASQQKQQQYYQQVQLMQQEQARQQTMTKRIYRAIYDYEAQDVDEVSFREGDVIFEVESIDSGWMTGLVERTGKTGMLPANYVEQAVI